MRRAWSVAAPYLVAAGGVAAITAFIAVVRPWVDLPNLTVAYLLLVLWLGARYGWPPAVSAALTGFVVYEWFFVPPFGTLWISAPRDFINLAVLLVAALAGGRLAASMAAREAGAKSRAQESGTLYELAIAALREPVGSAALSLLCERAVAAGVRSISLVAPTSEGVGVVAGRALPDDVLYEAERALAGGASVGARIREGQLELTRPLSTETDRAYVVLSGGVAVLGPPRRRLDPDDRRLLAALLGLAGLLLDRRQSAAVAERARALEASDRLKAAVLSSVSHELKSPLASLRAGLTTLLMPQAALDPDLVQLVAGLDHQAVRLDRLVGDLLTMSRLEAGLPLELAAHDLQELVGSALHGLGPAMGGVRVEVALDPALPPVLADELHVERVLTNLLENAAEWTREGGRVSVGASAGAEGVEVWVENEGKPISPADLEHLFDKFWTRRRGGSGLGLAICRRIVEAHGGVIRAENSEVGPRFVFRLQVAPVPLEARS